MIHHNNTQVMIINKIILNEFTPFYKHKKELKPSHIIIDESLGTDTNNERNKILKFSYFIKYKI